jgi:hypothetical protein
MRSDCKIVAAWTVLCNFDPLTTVSKLTNDIAEVSELPNCNMTVVGANCKMSLAADG